MGGPTYAIATVTPKRFELSFERNGAVTVNTIPQFLEMHFESSALLGRVIFGSPQGDDRIESVLTPRCATLPTVRARMMDEQDRNALTPQSEQPVLHRHPSVAGTLASVRAERGQIIEDDQVDTAQQWIKRPLSFFRTD